MPRLWPMKDAEQLFAEYDARCIENLRRERCTRHGAFLLVVFYIGFCALVGGIVRYSYNSADAESAAEVEAMGY